MPLIQRRGPNGLDALSQGIPENSGLRGVSAILI